MAVEAVPFDDHRRQKVGTTSAQMTELGLSARAHDKVLRLARTIGDIEGSIDIAPEHLAEAIQYRRLDRRL